MSITETGLGSDAREEVEHRLPQRVGDRNIRVIEDVCTVLARVQGDDLRRLRSGLVEDLKEIAGLTVDLTRHEQLRDPKIVRLLRDGEASVEVDPGHPDEPFSVESPAERVERLHRAQAGAAHDDPLRSGLAQAVDDEREIPPAAQIVPSGAAELPAGDSSPGGCT